MWKLRIAQGKEDPWLESVNNHIGRQHWEFDPEAGTSEERAEVERMRERFKRNRFTIKQSGDLLMKMQLRKENPRIEIPEAMKLEEREKTTEEAVKTSLKRAMGFFSTIQAHDGHWPADCAGPLFLLPALVITLYVTGDLDTILSPEHQKEMKHYTYNHQNEDGGWGFHVEGHSTMFGSALNYITLRLLGEGPNDDEDHAMTRGRRWILDHGGVIGVPSWGKFWLAEDLYHAQPLVQDMMWGFLHHFAEPILNRWPFSKLREKALKTTIEHIHYEDVNSKYVCFGGIIKFLAMLAIWVEKPNSEEHKKHLARVPDYCWLAEDGMKVQADGSQMWSVSLAIQAILASGLTQEYAPTLKKAHDFIKATQVRKNPSGNFREMNRHISKGGWTFSTQDQGWQTSDCTAEGLKAALLLSQMSSKDVGEKIEDEDIYDAVNIILSLQGNNGVISVWEPQRTFRYIEKFNPTEFFEDVLVERQYVECTSSVIQVLLLFKQLYTTHRREEIEQCISKGIQFIEESQNHDGSWYGCWGICFTYGTWFAVEALASCGRNYKNSCALRKACEFLLSKQLLDGGWGEGYLSCSNKVYTNLEGNRSNLVQTSWALLALMKAGQGDVDPTPIERGIRLLINSQMEDGDFPQQDIVGVFMKNCTLNYSSYQNIFPIWALGEYRNLQLQVER